LLIINPKNFEYSILEICTLSYVKFSCVAFAFLVNRVIIFSRLVHDEVG